MCIIILFLLFSFSSHSENTFTLVCTQNVFIPGQDIWFGLIFDESKKNTVSNSYPTVYISLTDKNLNSIQRNAIISKDAYFTSNYPIPSDLASGTYILSATVYNQTVQRIIEEQAFAIHILGNESGSYLNFDQSDGDIKLKPVPDKNTQSGKINTKIRNKVCFEEKASASSTNEFYSISDTEYLLQCKISVYLNTTFKDYLYGHRQRLKLSSHYQMPGYYDADQKQMFQMKNTEVPGEYLLTPAEDIKTKNVQYLDLVTGVTIDQILYSYPEPQWKNIKVQPLILNEQSLRSNLEKAEIISRLFDQHDQKRESRSFRQNAIQADNYIETKNYQLFQSTDLFLTEALNPIRVSKNKNGEYVVRLMRTDRKEFYESSPLLILNGSVMNTIQPLLDIPYQEIESFAFYRKINETRKSFGPQARYGTIEVNTKPTYVLKKSILPLPGVLSHTTYSRNFKQYEPADSHPWFYAIQYLGQASDKPFCYYHNDERGSFLLQRYSGTKLVHEEVIQVE